MKPSELLAIKTSMLCGNCKFWQRYSDRLGFGGCSSNKFVYSGNRERADLDGMEYWDSESYSAGFMTGQNFGCIHHEPKGSQ